MEASTLFFFGVWLLLMAFLFKTCTNFQKTGMRVYHENELEEPVQTLEKQK